MEKEKSIECPICGELMDKYIYDYILYKLNIYENY